MPLPTTPPTVPPTGRPGTHRAPRTRRNTRTGRSRLHDGHRHALYAVTGVACTLLVVAAGFFTLTSLHHEPPPTVTPPTTAPRLDADDAHRVDVAVGQTVVAATRLDGFSKAAPNRQQTVLTRTRINLDTATTALEELAHGTRGEVASQVETARKALGRLTTVVDGLRSCVHHHSASTHTKNNKKAKPKGDKAGCVVTTGDVETAREAGAAVAALLPYGTVTTSDVQALALEAKTQAVQEARKGSGSTVVVPNSFEP